MDNLSLLIVLKLSYNTVKINELHVSWRPYFCDCFKKQNLKKSIKPCTFHGKDAHN